MKNGILFRAVPDRGNARVQIISPEKVSFGFPNNMVLSAGILNELEKISTNQYGPFPNQYFPNADWVVNLCADEDEYATALKGLSTFLGLRRCPVFNSPSAIARSRRDRVAQSLQGIDGLIVPKCIRFVPTEFEDFGKTFDASDLVYPVLVRPQASQSGKDLVRIDHDEDWGKVNAIPWAGGACYMTQFVDCLHEGKYTKARVVVAGGQLALRHIVRSTNWITHTGARTQAWSDYELDRIQGFSHDDPLFEIGQKIHERIGLDFYGIDIGIVGDKFVFFEANAAMSILTTKNTPDYRKDEYLANIIHIETLVASALDATILGHKGTDPLA